MTTSDAGVEPGAVQKLALADGREIAYAKTPPVQTDAPGVVFLCGYRSDMSGDKAQHLQSWAQTTGRGFLRFDYTGHGASSGDFEEGTIGAWARDAYDAITMLTEGPQILVGSSMGGWISLITIKRLLQEGAQDRIAGFVGIAAAPDFTEDMMWSRFSEAQRTELSISGKVALPSEYTPEHPTIVTRRLIEEGRDNLVLREPLALPFPVRLLQGTADRDVELTVALQLLAHIECGDARLALVKDADHRMSTPRELALLVETLETLPR
ncbi:MAG: alpha/beta hydrolase [Neomegalonema sp.]|nr:alpha/beta hydrolase [Neomegalonema sp.]